MRKAEMKRSILFACLAVLLVFQAVHAKEAESFDEAKQMAVSLKKPILMEFLRPG